jgi:hypothetical protein
MKQEQTSLFEVCQCHHSLAGSSSRVAVADIQQGLIRNLGGGGVNPLKPNDTYRGRTAPLTSKLSFYIFIQHI